MQHLQLPQRMGNIHTQSCNTCPNQARPLLTPHSYSPSHPLQVGNCAVLGSDGLNPHIFPGLFGKVPAQLMHITAPPIKVSSNACYQGLFLQLQVSKFAL